MNVKKILAGAVASVMALSTMAVVANAATTTEEGTAYIMFSSGIGGDEWWDDGNAYVSTPTTAKITGNGQYTVSVKAGYNAVDEATGEEGLVEGAQGIMFAAIGVNNGEILFPGMVITIDSVSFDGNAVTLEGVPYTSSDDSVTTRVNLKNPWVSNIPDDARTAKGTQADGTIEADVTPNALANIGEAGDDANVTYFDWTEMSVTFTVSGIAGDEGNAGDGTANDNNTADNGDTNAPTADKNTPDTGVEGVAVVAGLAIVAAGAVVVAKKRK